MEKKKSLMFNACVEVHICLNYSPLKRTLDKGEYFKQSLINTLRLLLTLIHIFSPFSYWAFH